MGSLSCSFCLVILFSATILAHTNPDVTAKNLNKTEARLNRSLYEAALRGDTAKAEEALQKGANIDFQDSYGVTSLMVATSHQHTEVMHLLISAGANVNLQSRNRQTALIVAVSTVSLECVDILIDAGADVNLRDNSGHTALWYAEVLGLTEIAEHLKQAGAIPIPSPLISPKFGGYM